MFYKLIRNKRDEWLDPVKSAIETGLRHFMRAWGIRPIPPLKVNREMACGQLGLDVIPETVE